MHQPSNTQPETAHPAADPGTGTATQASTRPVDAERLLGFTLASIRYLYATAAHHRADAAMYRALANSHQHDPFLTYSDRVLMASSAEQRAELSEAAAIQVERRAADLRLENPDAVTATPGAPPFSTPLALVVLAVQRDRIVQTARLVMGCTRTVTRTWDRAGSGSWKSRDPEWAENEDRIGVELTEYMDALPLPSRVAAMLPQLPAPGSSAAAQAAQEVARG